MTTALGFRTGFVGIESDYVSRPDERAGMTIGAGVEAQKLAELLREALEDLNLPASRALESRRLRFHRLALEWKNDTVMCSSIHEMALHSAYQQIIGMGREALPFILDELQRKPDHWFWALSSIAGVDPVRPEDRGDIHQMARAWIEWGRANNLIDE